MAIDETVLQLRGKLTALRDQGLEFLTYAERVLKEKLGPNYEHLDALNLISIGETSSSYWDALPLNYRDRGIELRTDARQLMADIASVAQRGVLIDKADIVALGKNTKRMAASLLLRKFKSWGYEIHHDEGEYIGAEPPGQSEVKAPVDVCRGEFLEALDATFDLLQILGARNEVALSSPSSIANLKTYRPGTAFIMMRINPQQPELRDVRDTVAEVFRRFGIKAIRADELEHSEGITDQIIEEIEQSEHLFADLSYERPSVYYEIGYAHAIGKAPMLFRRQGTTIHFDLAYRNCPEYRNLAQLRELLEKRLTHVTGRGPSQA